MRRIRLLRAQAPGNRDTWFDALGNTVTEVSRVVSPTEGMPTDPLEGYLEVGRSALRAIRIAQLAAGRRDFASILDFPSGHGRVLRWLQAAYPHARLTASDLLPDGVDFCRDTFGAAGVYSNPEPTTAMFPERYELIFVGSLLTHVDIDQWEHLIDLWHDLLAPNGLLVVTTHGQLVAERMRAGYLYDYPEPGIRRLLRAYDHTGFGFLEDNPATANYGITVSSPAFVVGQLLRHKDLRVVLCTEFLWGEHQDVIAVSKSPISVTPV
jgi:SAM-dependent methyltransferase